MSHRRPSKHTRPARPLLAGQATTSSKASGRWVTRQITADRAIKEYLCPGCHQVIRPGTPHVVVWPHQPPLGSTSGADFRRHWHTACWNRER